MRVCWLAAVFTIVTLLAANVTSGKKRTQSSKLAVDAKLASGRHIKAPFFLNIKTVAQSDKQKVSFAKWLFLLEHQRSSCLTLYYSRSINH